MTNAVNIMTKAEQNEAGTTGTLPLEQESSLKGAKLQKK